MDTTSNISSLFVMPAETEPQAGIIMAWPTEYSILHEDFEYPNCNVYETRRELAEAAKTIAKYQPVEMFVRSPEIGEPRHDIADTNLQSARELLGNVNNARLNSTKNVHCLWARDTGPVGVRSLSGSIRNEWEPEDEPGVGFEVTSTCSQVIGLLCNYNGWGRKNIPNMDAYFAAYACQALGRSARIAPFIIEGGGIEVDGDGTLLATESAILNPNRNPGIDKPTMERYFSEFLGIRKTIWIPGKRGADITDDHIDNLARFSKPGTVLISRPFDDGSEGLLDNYHDLKRILGTSTDAGGRQFRIIEVPEPDPTKVLADNYHVDAGPCVSYVNYLVVNGAVIVAKFGDEEYDTQAAKVIGEQYPGRVVEQVYLHQVAMQGGGIHCATQNLPA